MPVRRRDSIVFTVVVSSIAAVAAVPIALLLALSGEPMVVVTAALFALIPVGPLVAAYLWLDRYEPEPRSLLAAGLAWGAFVATLLALVLQGIGGLITPLSDGASLAVAAPVTEEATKGLFLLLLLLWRRNELDGILDGIVYAGMVGIGFAFTENILYLAAAYNGTDGMGPGGINGLGLLFLIRGVASPFAHPLFTAFIGIGVGVAITSRIRTVKVVAPLLGYVVAVAAHALWNGSTLLADGVGFIAVYLLVMIPGFLVMAGFAVWMRTRERGVLDRALRDAAQRGLMPLEDVPHVVHLRARRAARRFALEHGGRPGLEAMRDYQQAAVELGYLHHRVLRGTAPGDYATRGQGFVERMHAARPAIAFPALANSLGGRHA
ncbi:PrsW family intramembrane metalloprotease [Nocardioides donggukensis]|uniref:PrsW family intramembrane metalloprotease n=1 Tax=Nocardioides donggukensis TaxID=2774019 RepID=A0A927K1X0_9ACTN|nr:PrsW family intramembrane metalloprotease [Nocardioides donggukensis]MBD8868887.1 PrsW family intramembrane metalloprotease [Nocardioides donggukensis]